MIQALQNQLCIFRCHFLQLSALLALLVLCAGGPIAHAQTLITGTINTYAPVTAITANLGGSDCNSSRMTIGATRGAPAPFAIGDLVLVIQAQGSLPRFTNNASFGSVSTLASANNPLSNAGNYEFNRIASVTGSDIVFTKPLSNIYDVAGRVQLVRVPEYTTGAAATGAITGAAWDGSSGGVIAMVVTGTLTLNVGTGINANGIGFRGGADFNANPAPACITANTFFYNNTVLTGANKGEGIVITNNNYRRGRGAYGNGGGGGNSLYGGGGGGSNGGAGGNGGGSYVTGCTGNPGNRPGIGGYALGSYVSNSRIFMGGGGGAGHRNGGTATPGGNGGGIVIVQADILVGNGNIISANGTAGSAGTNTTSGGGGGGAGGSILMNVNTYIGNLTLRANGGNGGNTAVTGNTNQCPGPGGGGSGGVIRTNAATPITVLRQVNAGAAGARGTIGGNCNKNPATAGTTGLNNNTLTISTNTSCTPTIVNIGTLCSGALGLNSFTNGDFGTTPGIPGSVPGPGEQLTTSAQWTNPTPITVLSTSTTAPGYTYENNPAVGPPDGSYLVGTGVRNPYGLIGGFPAWITLNGDNSSNGHMMVVNASFPPSSFYASPVTGLCEGTKFEFRADVINLYNPGIASESNPTGGAETWFPTCNPVAEPGCRQMVSASTRGCPFGGNCVRYSISPEIEFLINGAVVASSGPVPNDGAWHTYGITFETAPAVTSINLQLRNKAPGGIGNDLALDNISFRPCGPTVTLSSSATCPPTTITPTLGPDYSAPVFQWQRSPNGTDPYADIIGATSPTHTVTNPAEGGDAFRVLVAGSLANLTNPQCRVISSAVPLLCPLPVELLAFTATPADNKVYLNWQTASEINNERFIVERSADAAVFTPIGQVYGSGTTHTPQSYQLIDNQPMSGVNYYRLRQVDYDGRVQLSNIVEVQFIPAQRQGLALYPNPTTGALFVTAQHLKLNSLVDVFDMQGRRVHTAVVPGSTSSVQHLLDLSHLPKGIYTVRIWAGTETLTEKVVLE